MTLSVEPHPDYERLLRALQRLLPQAGAWRGVAVRSTSEKYARSGDLLSGKGAEKTGGRWNPPGLFPAVYGSLTPEIAMAEALENARYYGLEPWRLMRRVFCAVELRLDQALDLTDGEVRQRLGVSQRRMTKEDWRRSLDAGREALTQAIGRAAFEAGLEALLVPSAAARQGKNIVAFPTNLHPASTLREAKPG